MRKTNQEVFEIRFIHQSYIYETGTISKPNKIMNEIRKLPQADAIKKKRRDLEEYDRNERSALIAEHSIQMMHKFEDLEEECLQATGHEYYDRPLCMSIRLSQLPGKPSFIRECRWCKGLDYSEQTQLKHHE
jgi:hypothetical protein